MLIIEREISYEPEEVQLAFRGANITLGIRPLDGAVIEQISEKAKVYKFAENPKTKMMEMGEILTPANYDRELFDFLIASCKGVGTSKDKPLVLTAENKLKLVYQKPGHDEKPLWKTVLDAAQEISRKRHEALEAELKNS